MLTMLDRTKARIDEAHAPGGFSVNLNDEPAAGQTVPHMHLHQIPRHRRDPPDAGGGVRYALPFKMRCWR